MMVTALLVLAVLARSADRGLAPPACPKVEVAVQHGPCQHAAIMTKRDKPWLFRTYAGHSTAADSNTLFRTNLPRARPACRWPSTCRPRPAMTADHVLARGEVGKVGVPVSHIGDMRTLFDSIPLATMNTSMTINATAAWLLALYVAVADEQGAPRGEPVRHHAERHHQGISLARHLCLPARALDAAHHRHDRLLHRGNCRSGTR